MQQDALTDQHSHVDDLCCIADALPLAQLLQGGANASDAAAFEKAAAMAGQQPAAAALLVSVAQVNAV